MAGAVFVWTFLIKGASSSTTVFHSTLYYGAIRSVDCASFECGVVLQMKSRFVSSLALLAGLTVVWNTTCGADRDSDSIYAYARQRVEEVRRPSPTRMPVWLKKNRDAYRNRLEAAARKAYEQTGTWFLARGATRITDEQETVAVWGDLLKFYGGDLTRLPFYSRENHRQAIEFWQSWQNLKTGRLYNRLYQDPQHPERKRQKPGNRRDYSPDRINTKYVPHILSLLGASLPKPVNTAVRADTGVDTFDQLWAHIARWESSPAGAIAVAAAWQLDGGRLDKIPQAEAGLAALVRDYSKETGMWWPAPSKDFPWGTYGPSAGFKIISRVCGYIGMESFPEDVLATGIDNLIAHRRELYATPATARNYGEMMAHYLMLTDYRHDELLDAMELCLEGFRDPKAWENTGTGSYCIFGHAFIGAFMNWEDLPFDQAMPQYFRFEHGCKMKWRFVVGPYGNWVNAIRKDPEEIFGHPKYDVKKYSLKARNRGHWAKETTELVPQQSVRLELGEGTKTGQGTWSFTLTREQLATLQLPYFKATWSGAYDVYVNGKLVKKVRYNLPVLPAGWYIPPAAARTLHAGKNVVTVKVLGPGKEPSPGAPLAASQPFLRLGLINWATGL